MVADKADVGAALIPGCELAHDSGCHNAVALSCTPGGPRKPATEHHPVTPTVAREAPGTISSPCISPVTWPKLLILLCTDFQKYADSASF